MTEERGFRFGSRQIVGLVVITLGVIFLLNNLGYLEAERLLRFWPVVLIGVGIAQLLRRTLRDAILATFWIGLGGWFLLDELGWVTVSPWQYVLPLAVIFLGLSLTLGALWRRSVAADSASSVSITAILSGLERRVAAADFRHADITAIMGGGTLDLRDSEITGDEAVVEIFAMWGGAEILVPDSWKVDLEILPLLGGFEDTTRADPAAEKNPRLVVKGTVIMGGGEIKN